MIDLEKEGILKLISNSIVDVTFYTMSYIFNFFFPHSNQCKILDIPGSVESK